MSLQLVSRANSLKKLAADTAAKTVSQNRPNYYKLPTKYAEFAPLLRIRSGEKVVRFQPYEYQLKLHQLLKQHKKAIIFKTRQLGVTEYLGSRSLHKALLNPGYAGAFLSIGQTESSNVSVRIQNMPSQIKNLAFKSKSKTELKIKFGGKLWFRPSTDDAARSFESIADLIFDEFAFPKNAEALYASAVPTQEAVGDAAGTIIASTMSEFGKLSFFWELLDSNNGQIDAEEQIEAVKAGKLPPLHYWVDETGWLKVIVHWKAHPIYGAQPDYLEHTKTKLKLPEDKLQREFNLGIPASGGSLFDFDAVKRNAIGYWEQPDTSRAYLICIDPNFGGTTNADYFVTQVWDITTCPYQLVAEYRANDKSVEYSKNQTIALILKYCPVLTAIESNSGGKVIAENLVTALPNQNIQVTLTTSTSKRVNTDRIAYALENNLVNYPQDWAGIYEMKRFSSQSRTGLNCNDDTITAWAAGFAHLEAALELIDLGDFSWMR